MTLRHALLLAAAALAVPGAAVASDTDGAAAAARVPLPSQLSEAQRSDYRFVFSAIRAGDWTGAQARLASMGEGPLHDAARAELYLAPGSPKVELDPLMGLLARAPDLPQAPQLARLARTRGATSLPDLPSAQDLVWQSGQPRRSRPAATKGDRVAAELEPLIQPLIVADQPSQAEALLLAREAELGPEARTEFQQRIAWSYYLIGNDAAARQMAARARAGRGDWAVQADWVTALASWRLKECGAAGEAFQAVATRSTDPEMNAAGHYWAARADMMCGKPERVQARLRSAARLGETFYGLLAESALGIRAAGASKLHDYRDSEWRSVAARPNATRAMALAEIGERTLADQFVRHQARIGGRADHDGLIHLAEQLNLASTVHWLAHNAPRGTSVDPSARYPSPDWKPARGWRVDRALAYAHALQESGFRTQVVSPAGASGLMQVRPGTAGDMARSRGEVFEPRQLSEPSLNLEYGQSYLEHLRDLPATQGLLPKVMAAYNAGPGPVATWNVRRFDQGDPLLYIESLPYWETRGYVPIVFRNYWIYEQKANAPSTSRRALAQGLWPRFPGPGGGGAVRMEDGQMRPVTLGTD
jgi:soluble lytic murein transglycosylase-like protein